MTADDAQSAPTRPGSLAAAAAQPGAEPCDIAFDAMPALVIGDLPPEDRAWLSGHAGTCRWCADQLAGFERIDDTLRACRAPELPPPAVTLPKRTPRTTPERRPEDDGPWRRAWRITVPSPVGELIVAATKDGLCGLTFGGFRTEGDLGLLLQGRGIDLDRWDEDIPLEAQAMLDRAARQLRQYFAGERTRFDLPLDLGGVPEFTRAVLDAAAGIPFGGLDTYQGLAGRIGRSSASRAVGNALGRNPLPVIVPCHRVVATGGGLGGYTGGLEIKQRLLRIEGSMLGA